MECFLPHHSQQQQLRAQPLFIEIPLPDDFLKLNRTPASFSQQVPPMMSQQVPPMMNGEVAPYNISNTLSSRPFTGEAAVYMGGPPLGGFISPQLFIYIFEVGVFCLCCLYFIILFVYYSFFCLSLFKNVISNTSIEK